ncbi:nickel/cobalt efflux transporter RcnA [Roseospira marina]|uniref:Nickel/cobalt efflux system n=1 Tax=Roseospira marina TaxID=140057 RepID=A0A5M6I7H3_9PROT|nr:nickel/cobalt efflux transporter [Roseospira marina]KAA5604083.1 nickel/cobalt efflux transporter RcnA [Roseospira marina]MBB4315819.1 nickel/cobalt exporter [Roseospira marina]MBB5088942.1 nickel/cobalt exporter [Roseospira marina]
MDITAALADETGQPVVLAATALALGALHGLEPGHSKTMMAAFIVAVRGTVCQAILLGLSAALSHTLIVWILALLALWLGEAMIGEALEPWFMMASGAIILVIAAWMGLRTRQTDGRHGGGHGDAHDHDHHHGHDPHHDHDHHHHGHDHAHGHGPDAAASHHHNDPLPQEGTMDAHARAHARGIETRFGGGGGATTGQVILFGLTGGLIPCSAAITVLILCLHLDRIWLGVGLVGAFSLGLAVTLVAAGVVAAVGLRAVSRRTRRFDGWLEKAPYVSATIIAVIGVGMIAAGWAHLAATPGTGA